MSASIGTPAELAAGSAAVLKSVSGTSPVKYDWYTVSRKISQRFLRQPCATAADERPAGPLSGWHWFNKKPQMKKCNIGWQTEMYQTSKSISEGSALEPRHTAQ